LVALLVGVSQATTWGWSSVSVLGLLAASVLLAVGWTVVEMRSRKPLIDMRMMRIPAVWATNLVALLFGLGMYSLMAFLPEFVQTPSSAGYGFSASITESGLIVAPMSASMFGFGVLSGRLASRFSAKAVLVFGSALCVPPLLIMAFAHAQIWQIAVATLLLGAGFGLAFSAMSGIIVDSVPSSQTGVASGMNANIRTIGGSIGAAVMASVVTSGVSPGGLPKESGYTAGFAMLAGMLLLAALAGLLIPPLRGVRDPHQQQQAAMSHPELAIVAGGTLVGNESE
jgi:predicted MFS family arabinose efflux permease